MNPDSCSTSLPRSSGLLSKVSGIKTDTSSVKFPTRIGNMTRDSKSTSLPPTSARSKERRRMEKRKKAGGSGHPSVVIATSWTNRQEQVEEVRAREAMYCAPRSDVPAVEAAGTKNNPIAWWMESVKTDTANAKPRARRPWEWSAQDCEALMFDALSHLNGVGDQSPKMLETKDVSTAPSSTCAASSASSAFDVVGDGLSPSRSANGHGRECKSAEESLSRVKPPARRVRGRCKGSIEVKRTEAIGCGNGFQVSSEVETSTLSANDILSVTEQGAIPVKRMKHASTSPRAISKEKTKVQGGHAPACPSNPLSGSPPSKVDAVEDERKARELSAALNRNRPRRGRSQWYREMTHSDESDIHGAKLNVVDPKFKHSGRKDASGKKQHMRHGSSGKSVRSTYFMRKRVTETCTPLETISVSSDPAVSRKELEVHPYIRARLKFGLGTKAEVWWDDGKWYRCRISKISGEGRSVELEFLPYRRKVIAREFSPNLDLDELIQDGHLVLPGTHLEWTEA